MHLISLTELTKEDITAIFALADALENNEYTQALQGKTILMFFPSTSIRTRTTFEKGIYLMQGQSILFPIESLDKKESLQDVMGYLNLWADALIVRHNDIEVIKELARHANIPIINAMSDVNHPCEVISDLYALSKIRKDYRKDEYLFCGEKGNIAGAWKEAAQLLELSLTQCCPAGYEMEGVAIEHALDKAIQGKDIILTDSIPAKHLSSFQDYTIGMKQMEKANPGAVLNPCPPFYRGEEVDADVLASSYFVGYEFKKHLLHVQQAILLYCMGVHR